MRGGDPVQRCDTKRDADGAADQEGQQSVEFERRSQFPNRVALDQQSIGDDQACRLRRRENVKPGTRGNDAEGKAGKARDHRCREARRNEYQQIEGIEVVHGIPPRSGKSRRKTGQRLACKGG
jgi:hypothetical protein